MRYFTITLLPTLTEDPNGDYLLKQVSINLVDDTITASQSFNRSPAIDPVTAAQMNEDLSLNIESILSLPMIDDDCCHFLNANNFSAMDTPILTLYGLDINTFLPRTANLILTIDNV